jgi:hypothetical protein
MDMYNKRVDELVKRDLTCDWEWLRGERTKTHKDTDNFVTVGDTQIERST